MSSKRFAPNDVEAFLDFGMELKKYWDLIAPTLLREPPTFAELDAIFSDPDHKRMFKEFVTASAADILDARFESANLKGMFSFTAASSAHFPTDAPGTGLELIDHSCSELEGEFGVWGQVKGGMGAIAEALRKAAESRGVVIETDHKVDQVLVARRKVQGVRLADGSTRLSPIVVSNADPYNTFAKLLPQDAAPPSFHRQVQKMDFRGTMARVHYAVSELPRYRGVTTSAPGPEHYPLTLLDFTLTNIRDAAIACREGRLPEKLAVELLIPTVVDPSLAPPGQHIVSTGVQYTPFELADGSWDDFAEEFERRVRATMEEFAPGFSDSVIGYKIITPLDLEREYHLSQGNIFHGAMLLGQWFDARPMVGCANYRTPVQGLYLCGAGTHPGGGVSGANGHNAAMAILRDIADPPDRSEWDRRASASAAKGPTRATGGKPLTEWAWKNPRLRPLMVWGAGKSWTRRLTQRMRRPS